MRTPCIKVTVTEINEPTPVVVCDGRPKLAECSPVDAPKYAVYSEPGLTPGVPTVMARMKSFVKKATSPRMATCIPA